ncbi:MAG TPA: ectonucleotide pyrophosphatase/phosphodiesterase [Terracidiphilus sp.]|jgi:predicted AlkP superfamily pyrophosphatase or phosphodiesterase|nr:ectonucleotide pyrophosphatase/phosphodiesterase [Terracidiphilus sp.]
MKMFGTAAALLIFGMIGCSVLSATDASVQHPKVVVISLDAFGAATLQDPYIATPALHALMKSGAYAKAMQPINPSVTWPNHTAIITGQDASRHHVLVNGLIVGQRTDTKPHVEMWVPKTRLVAVPTLYDVAHQATLTTAQVDWVAITDPGTIDWAFTERPNPDAPIEQELIQSGETTRSDLIAFTTHPGAWRDRIYTDAAIDILRNHRPDLLLVHLLSMDAIQHATGFGTEADYNTEAFLDDRVAEIVDAVKANGDLDRTTFIVVSDHGQQTFHNALHPNVLLSQENLQTASASTPAYAVEDGGCALVFQKNATPASVAALKKLFASKTGIYAALTEDEASALGWPKPGSTDQAPDLLLYAAEDYGFSPEAADTFVTKLDHQRGNHGYPNTFPLMQAIFIASGAGIKNVGEIPPMLNLDVAPTIAHILQLQLPDAQGKALEAILK